MTVTNIAIKYRTSVVVLTVLLVALGLMSYVTIPKEASPSIEIPLIVVTSIYPGASPDDIESLVTQEIEREIQNINGIKEIRSTSTEGVSTVVVEFNPDVSMDEAYQRVRDKVSIAKPELPDEVEEPIISEIDFQDFPIMVINLAADYSLARLKDVAEDLQDELESIASVLEVDVVGGLEQEVQVDIDLNALQGYNLSFNDIISTIQFENTTIPGGSIDVDRLNYLVRVSGEFDDPAEIEDLVVKMPDAVPGRPTPAPIYVRDVADVSFGFKERDSFARLETLRFETEDGRLVHVPEEEVQSLQVISLNVKKRSGENILDTVEEVKNRLEAFSMPSGTEVVITGDLSENVRTLVNDLENNIISGLLFVIAVLLFFLGVRNAVLVGIAIPLSMFISFLLFSALGYTLNFIILFSLIIALGMLVDNAIVIVENIYRFREEGHSRFEAARLATAEVGGAVVASTATTVAAFAPMLLWPGIIGEFMSYLPLTLIVTLTSSLFVALVINPVMTGIFIRLEGEARPKRTRAARLAGAGLIALAALLIGVVNPITLGVLVVGGCVLFLLHRHVMEPIGKRFVQTGLPAFVEKYKGFLQWMLQRDYSVRRAYLRNTLSLTSFTGGFVLLLLGLTMAGLGAPAASIPMQPGQPPFTIGAAGLILLLPGLVLLALGIIGILFHTFEAIFRGAGGSIKAGLVAGVVLLAPVGLMAVFTGSVTGEVLLPLFLAPALLITVGALGLLRRKRGPIVLTDNRSQLLNASLGTLIVIFFLYSLAPTGTEFFPTTDPSQVQVLIDGSLGTRVETSDQYAREAERRLNTLMDDMPAAEANVKNVLVNVGVGGDIFSGGTTGPERSRVTLNLVDYADRAEPSSQTLARIRDQLRGIPGTEIEVQQDQQGPPTGPPVNIEISGEDWDEIVRVTREMKAMLIEASESGTIPGLVDLRDNMNTGRPELAVEIDPVRAARFGLNTTRIASDIRTAVNGIEASTYRTGKDEYDITVRLAEEDRNTLEDLRNLSILHEGNRIPLVAVADFREQAGLGSVTRLDLERVVTIEGGVAPGFAGPQVLGTVREHLTEYVAALPPGINVSYTGESEDQEESFSFLGTALLIGLALIFMIMVAQFNRISAPFIIMIAVGLSFIGVILGMILSRNAFGLMTFIGVISLAGIVVNNNIVLVDYIMQLRERGLSKSDAIVVGGATRLRPVVLTALTTVLGLLPLTFGLNIDFIGLLTRLDPAFQIGSENTQFWGPMGTTIIAGLLFATFLTLVIVPVMYSLFDSLASTGGRIFGTRASTPPYPTAVEGTPATRSADEPFAEPATGDGAHGLGEGIPGPEQPTEAS